MLFIFSGKIIKVIVLIKKSEISWVFGFGALVYSLIEVLFRGHTHWTMTLAGGVAFSLIYLMNINIKSGNMLVRCIAGAVIITAIEFSAGCIVNLYLKMNIWDYTREKFNILGQICPLFSFAWFLISIPTNYLSVVFRNRFTENKTF